MLLQTTVPLCLYEQMSSEYIILREITFAYNDYLIMHYVISLLSLLTLYFDVAHVEQFISRQLMNCHDSRGSLSVLLS